MYSFLQYDVDKFMLMLTFEKFCILGHPNMTVIAKKLKSRGELPWCKLKKEENRDDSFIQIFRVRERLIKTFSFTFRTNVYP